MKLVEVVGSINVDLVSRTPRVPSAGETLKASSFEIDFGGKGANQAVACARMVEDLRNKPNSAIEVKLVGAVGNDQFDRDSLKQLANEHINCDGVKTLEKCKTGTTVIIVEEDAGQNRILFAPGANYEFTSDLIALDEKHQGNIVLFQLELLFETVVTGLRKAKNMHKITVLNPAPASPLPNSCVSSIDYLVVNESEASVLTGVPETKLSVSLDEASSFVLSKGVKCMIITLGAEGVYWRLATDRTGPGQSISAHRVQAVDTTAAGDAFLGAFAAYLTEQHESLPSEDNVRLAIAYANECAALSVQKRGAQASLPFQHELKKWRSENRR